MSVSIHWMKMAGVAGGLSLLLLAGCKDKPGGVPASAPAAENVSPSAADMGKAPSDTGSASALLPSNSAGPVAAGVDDQDDPRGPDFLPKSGKNVPWVKREPVQVYDPGELATAVVSEDSSRLGYYRIRSIARCAYELPKNSGQGAALARVLVISAETPEDAYGLMTCRAPSSEQFRIGGETRVTRTDGIALHAWQGSAYVNVSSLQSDSATTEELIRLLNYICGRIRRESIPRILEALPRDSSMVNFRWLVRNLASLPADTLQLAGDGNLRQLNEVLGLTRETIMCVGAYSLRGGEPNVVWVVQYPNVRAAHDAAARYKKYLEDHASDPLALSTNLLAPQGVYLAGSWTAELESMQYMLPRIQQLLPSP